ncbi:MAG: DUF4038 domain-containing protein, partial [Treponema sp.]|nr:DUF4038 domain-containing protein [Treponema sp.]
MHKLQIDNKKHIFTDKGKPFFYFADTAWMAFSNLSLSEWGEYIEFRRQQGFTAVQISILPVMNDTSIGEHTLFPYKINADGSMDFSSLNDRYFEKAVRMVEMLAAGGLVPVLVVLWNNYVPTAWAAKQINNTTLMPEEYLKDYAALVVKLFGPFNPVYLISGDTGFDTD